MYDEFDKDDDHEKFQAYRLQALLSTLVLIVSCSERTPPVSSNVKNSESALPCDFSLTPLFEHKVKTVGYIQYTGFNGNNCTLDPTKQLSFSVTFNAIKLEDGYSIEDSSYKTCELFWVNKSLGGGATLLATQAIEDVKEIGDSESITCNFSADISAVPLGEKNLSILVKGGKHPGTNDFSVAHSFGVLIASSFGSKSGGSTDNNDDGLIQVSCSSTAPTIESATQYQSEANTSWTTQRCVGLGQINTCDPSRPGFLIGCSAEVKETLYCNHGCIKCDLGSHDYCVRSDQEKEAIANSAQASRLVTGAAVAPTFNNIESGNTGSGSGSGGDSSTGSGSGGSSSSGTGSSGSGSSGSSTSGSGSGGSGGSTTSGSGSGSGGGDTGLFNFNCGHNAHQSKASCISSQMIAHCNANAANEGDRPGGCLCQGWVIGNGWCP